MAGAGKARPVPPGDLDRTQCRGPRRAIGSNSPIMSSPIVRSLGNRASVRIYSDFPALSHAAAEEFVRSGMTAIEENGRFDVALSGGSTPRSVYSLLASAQAGSLPWEKVHLF